MKNPFRALRVRRHRKRLAAFRANLPCSDETLMRIQEDMRRAFAVLPTGMEYQTAWTRFVCGDWATPPKEQP